MGRLARWPLGRPAWPTLGPARVLLSPVSSLGDYESESFCNCWLLTMFASWYPRDKDGSETFHIIYLNPRQTWLGLFLGPSMWPWTDFDSLGFSALSRASPFTLQNRQKSYIIKGSPKTYAYAKTRLFLVPRGGLVYELVQNLHQNSTKSL